MVFVNHLLRILPIPLGVFRYEGLGEMSRGHREVARRTVDKGKQPPERW